MITNNDSEKKYLLTYSSEEQTALETELKEHSTLESQILFLYRLNKLLDAEQIPFSAAEKNYTYTDKKNTLELIEQVMTKLETNMDELNEELVKSPEKAETNILFKLLLKTQQINYITSDHSSHHRGHTTRKYTTKQNHYFHQAHGFKKSFYYKPASWLKK